MNEIVINNWKLIENLDNLEGYWMTGEEVGQHLGYSEPRISINNIYKRNIEYFIYGVDSTDIKLISVDGKIRDTRIYSERGVLKLIRKSSTEKSDAIMDEVFDVFIEAKKQKLPQTPKEIMARALIIAHETILQIEAENKKKTYELGIAHKKIGFLQCQKELRATEAQIIEAPRRVLEHFCLPDYKTAMLTIYRQWKKVCHSNLQDKWRKANNKRKVSLYEFLIENELSEKYLQIVDSLINSSREFEKENQGKLY